MSVEVAIDPWPVDGETIRCQLLTVHENILGHTNLITDKNLRGKHFKQTRHHISLRVTNPLFKDLIG